MSNKLIMNFSFESKCINPNKFCSWNDESSIIQEKNNSYFKKNKYDINSRSKKNFHQSFLCHEFFKNKSDSITNQKNNQTMISEKSLISSYLKNIKFSVNSTNEKNKNISISQFQEFQEFQGNSSLSNSSDEKVSSNQISNTLLEGLIKNNIRNSLHNYSFLKNDDNNRKVITSKFELHVLL